MQRRIELARRFTVKNNSAAAKALLQTLTDCAMCRGSSYIRLRMRDLYELSRSLAVPFSSQEDMEQSIREYFDITMTTVPNDDKVVLRYEGVQPLLLERHEVRFVDAPRFDTTLTVEPSIARTAVVNCVPMYVLVKSKSDRTTGVVYSASSGLTGAGKSTFTSTTNPFNTVYASSIRNTAMCSPEIDASAFRRITAEAERQMAEQRILEQQREEKELAELEREVNQISHNPHFGYWA